MLQVFKFFAFVVMACCSFSLVSCGDDEEDILDTAGQAIVGTWEVVEFEVVSQYSVEADFKKGDKLEFKADGTVSSPSGPGTWTLGKEYLIVKLDDPEAMNSMWKIEKATSDTFELTLDLGTLAKVKMKLKKV